MLRSGKQVGEAEGEQNDSGKPRKVADRRKELRRKEHGRGAKEQETGVLKSMVKRESGCRDHASQTRDEPYTAKRKQNAAIASQYASSE